MQSEKSRTARKHTMIALANLATDAILNSGNATVPMIRYAMETEETLSRFSDFDREYFRLLPGEEYFYVMRRNGDLLYVVNVTCDSPLTAFSELTQLIARKF